VFGQKIACNKSTNKAGLLICVHYYLSSRHHEDSREGCSSLFHWGSEQQLVSCGVGDAATQVIPLFPVDCLTQVLCCVWFGIVYVFLIVWCSADFILVLLASGEWFLKRSRNVNLKLEDPHPFLLYYLIHILFYLNFKWFISTPIKLQETLSPVFNIALKPPFSHQVKGGGN
jgi:hypothetical protein